jgi:hypothetical protein
VLLGSSVEYVSALVTRWIFSFLKGILFFPKKDELGVRGGF